MKFRSIISLVRNNVNDRMLKSYLLFIWYLGSFRNVQIFYFSNFSVKFLQIQSTLRFLWSSHRFASVNPFRSSCLSCDSTFSAATSLLFQTKVRRLRHWILVPSRFPFRNTVTWFPRVVCDMARMYTRAYVGWLNALYTPSLSRLPMHSNLLLRLCI